MENMYVFAGGFEHETFTSDMQLVSAKLDEATGRFTPAHANDDGFNYGFICCNHAGTCLYAVDTRLDRGSVVSYRIGDGGKATLQSELRLEGAVFGLHCTASKDDRFVLAAFASSSSVFSCTLAGDGSALGVADVFKLPKGTPTTPRQISGPAPHQIRFDRSGRYLFIPDIHTDRLYCMAFDPATGRMTQRDCVPVDGGQGPRHVAVHPSNKWVFLLTEMGTSIYLFEFDDSAGRLTQKQSVRLVPQAHIDSHAGDEIQSAGIVISPDGRFVLASMRNYLTVDGFDRIFSAAIDGQSGRIDSISSFSCGGLCPRMIDFSPSGKFLLSGNKNSDEIVSIAYDSESGGLHTICGRTPAPANAALCFSAGRRTP